MLPVRHIETDRLMGTGPLFVWLPFRLLWLRFRLVTTLAHYSLQGALENRDCPNITIISNNIYGEYAIFSYPIIFDEIRWKSMAYDITDLCTYFMSRWFHDMSWHRMVWIVKDTSAWYSIGLPTQQFETFESYNNLRYLNYTKDIHFSFKCILCNGSTCLNGHKVSARDIPQCTVG